MKKIISAALTAAMVTALFPTGILAADEACVYEAESAYTGGWAVRADDSAASDGAVVTHVGGTNTDIGTVVFDVWADSAGEYDCVIAYRSREDSSFYVRVNWDGWDPSNDDKVTTTAGEDIVTVTRKIQLNKGWNKVKIYSLEGIEKSNGKISKDKRIDIDKITVNTAGRKLDGIIENTVSGAGTERKVYMAKDQSVSADAEFEVTAEKDGIYDMNVWYNAADFRAMEIHVDGKLANTVLCPITGEDYNIETISAKLNLTKGKHRISFKNEKSLPPEIDKIQLLLSKEQKENTAESTGVQEFKNSKVSVKYDMATGKADFVSGGVTRVKGFEAAVKVENAKDTGNGDKVNSVVKSSDYTSRTVEESILSTGFGLGTRYDVISKGEGLPDMRQSFYIYNNLDYVLTSVKISSPDGVSTNFMAPIAAAGEDVVNIGEKTDARSLCMPFANDNYTTYDPQKLGGSHTSYWATCLFDANSRNAVVAGSVDHDTWKTGTSTYGTADNGSVNLFGAFAGIWSREQTYDFLPHGSLDGESVESPKMFLGYFDDWRDGMEAYGEANNNNQPRLHWGGGNIFGYSSWNAYGSNVSLETMKTASDVVDGLDTFHDENGVQWINIDSYWDNLTQNNDESQLKEYIAYCKSKGQKVGMYTSRFICWDDDLWNWGKRGYAITDKYGNSVAPAKPDKDNVTSINCFAFDPTSNEAKNDTKYWMEHWKELGFEYLKVDFMNFAAVEGVFQDKSVKTGLQAYNQACEQILQYVDPDKFFINYSIAPLFPYQYAHSRRLSCDIWTEKGNLDAAKYMLNALNYSWWQAGTVYEFTDPDQISMDVRPLIGGNEEQARAKYTSGVIAGMMVLSNKYDDALDTGKNITKNVAQNEEVNKIARLGKAFRPVEATESCPERGAADPSDTFTLKTDDTFYMAVFNYGDSNTSKSIDLARAGLDSGKKYTVTELWTDTTTEEEGTLNTGNMNAYSCKLYKIPLANGSINEDILRYTEDFESDTTAENVANQTNGWTNGGDEQKHFNVGEYSETGNSSRIYRQAVTDWWKSDISNLNLYDNGVYKLTANGAAQADAEAQVRDYLSKNLSVSFKANFAAPNPKDFGEDYIRIKDENGNTLVGISMKQDQRIEGDGYDSSTGKLVLTHIMNDALTESTEKTILGGLDIAERNSNWYNFKIDIDPDARKVRVSVNDSAGEWLPIGNADKTGAAESIGMVKEIEFGIWSGAWWQSLYIDDISVTSTVENSENNLEITGARILNSDNSPVIYGGDTIHSKITAVEGAEVSSVMGYSTNGGRTYSPLDEDGIVPENADKLMLAATAELNGNSVTKTIYVNVGEDDNTIENEDFSERAQIQEWAKAGKNGWNGYGDADTQIQASDDHDGSFRIANSNFFQQSWIEHSFVDVEKSRLMSEGATETEASEEAQLRLENNPTVSLDVRFDNRPGNDKSVNHAHVRVYDINGKVIGALYNENQKNDSGAFIYDKLYLISMNVAGDALEKTFITDVDPSKLYNVKFEFNNDTNKLRVSVDGNIVKTAQGEWTDVASVSCSDSGEIGAAQPYDFGAVAKLQLGIYWSNWWQSVYFDNIRVAPSEYEINSSITGGTAEYTHGRNVAQTAAGGNRVTVSFTNDSSLKPGVKNVSVKTESGAEIAAMETGNDKYTFVMPREEVTVSAEFEKNSAVETASPSPEATDEPKETASPSPEATDEPKETVSPSPEATDEPKETTSPSPEVTDTPYGDGISYIENFEGNADNKLAEISDRTNGWSYDGNSDDNGNHIDKLNLWVGDNGSESDNSLRFASTDWYKTMWLNLDLKENGISKYVDAGYDADIAEEKVTDYLNNSMSLSFKVKFENQGIDSNSTHEQYIRVKGDRYNVITELRLKDDILYLSAMNEDMSQDVLYQIDRVDISSQNNQWHTVTLNINKEDNTYSLIFDGNTFGGTPWGENIPAGIASDEDRSIGSVASMEFGHFWSGWWQCMYLDDITIGDTQSVPPIINPEWGVKELDINAETGDFTLTVSAGEMRYNDTVIYAALVRVLLQNLSKNRIKSRVLSSL